MAFSPTNDIVKRCLQGMALEEKGDKEEAAKVFLQAWSEATQDFEKFLSAHCIARCQANPAEALTWLETALHWALKIHDDSVRSAIPALHLNIAKCNEALGEPDKANRHSESAARVDVTPSDKGPFFHGTKADLRAGDFLMPGGSSNYQPGLKMNHIYFTASMNGAGLAAALAKGDGPERVYVVEVTGAFEHDPNVTDKKFPGNLTRSYRSAAPLKVIGEVENWSKTTPEELQKWRERLATNKGEIIN